MLTLNSSFPTALDTCGAQHVMLEEYAAYVCHPIQSTRPLHRFRGMILYVAGVHACHRTEEGGDAGGGASGEVHLQAVPPQRGYGERERRRETKRDILKAFSTTIELSNTRAPALTDDDVYCSSCSTCYYVARATGNLVETFKQSKEIVRFIIAFASNQKQLELMDATEDEDLCLCVTCVYFLHTGGEAHGCGRKEHGSVAVERARQAALPRGADR